MATTYFHNGKRPAILVDGFEKMPSLRLKAINSRTATFRSKFAVGDLAVDRDRVRPAENTEIRITSGDFSGYHANVVEMHKRGILANPHGFGETIKLNDGDFIYVEQDEDPFDDDYADVSPV